MAGCFITFEGGEGAGKSTQIERLKARLSEMGQPVLVTREPGGSPHAEEIRAFILEGHAKHLGPFAEALLFAAARIDHLDKTIVPALTSGTHVLCDRFADSTRAYQGSLGNIDKGLIDRLETITLRGVKPHLTLILDLPAETGLARAGARQAGKGEGADRFEKEDLSFHQSLRQAYLSIARAAPERCAVINADQNPDEVAAAIWAALRERLPQVTEPPARSLDVA
ncbi:dTMP kinase [Microvirga terrae]|uniref:Thymidylate kinase n=1 Tax=Microvirga terrae TaxID=2740529 RepID=A0ABY5RM91_9HYPH|nr:MULTISPECIES: dTMP kinase [Microvirga]MBQ0821817.1 dTMP kinase [Microvirga sp. HBU67558]UVF17496.1 dTMP kinase [Microvirga terrae]